MRRWSQRRGARRCTALTARGQGLRGLHADRGAWPRRGPDTIRYGPLKPVGLRDPRTGHRPWAVVQLRRENAEGTPLQSGGLPDQPQIWGAEAGLFDDPGARARGICAVRRDAPQHLPRFAPPAGRRLSAAERGTGICFAGQITGVEGYIESAMSGILAGKQLARRLRGLRSAGTAARHDVGGAVRLHQR